MTTPAVPFIPVSPISYQPLSLRPARRPYSVDVPQLDLDTLELACVCNDDQRFQEAGWAETPSSVEQLLLSQTFGTALAKLMSPGSRLVVGAVVASVYGCRVKERGAPRKVGPHR